MAKAMAVIVVLCFAASCFAGQAPSPEAQREVREKATTVDETAGQSGQQNRPLMIWTGKVVSTKKSFNQVIIKDPNRLTEKTFTLNPDVFKTIKLGDTVVAKYREGSSTIESIKVIRSPANEKIY